MTAIAEFTLKQSKVNLSVDSNLRIKSGLETAVAPGMTLQFSAELHHFTDHYRFGSGLMIGGA